MPHNTMTFQQRLQKNQVVLAPGIYDALSALITGKRSGWRAANKSMVRPSPLSPNLGLTVR